MSIQYREIKVFTKDEIESLFLSVHWESGKYPEKLVEAMKHSSLVISAWDDDKLIGLIRCLDDCTMTAFIHYILVHPTYQKDHIGANLLLKALQHYQDYLYIKIMPSDKMLIPFYQKYGFKIYDNYCAMEIKRL